MFNRKIFFLGAIFMTMIVSLGFAEEKVDFQISSYSPPDICTGFKSILLQNKESVIVLSDDSQWIVRNRCAEEVLSDILDNWEVGDEVRIGERVPQKYEGKFVLKNVRTGAVYLVDLNFNFVSQRPGYFINRIDQNGYAVVTQNGLEFIFGWIGACTVQYWRREDPIIINKSHFSSNEDYLIINARNGKSAWASLIYWD